MSTYKSIYTDNNYYDNVKNIINSNGEISIFGESAFSSISKALSPIKELKFNVAKVNSGKYDFFKIDNIFNDLTQNIQQASQYNSEVELNDNITINNNTNSISPVNLIENDNQKVSSPTTNINSPAEPISTNTMSNAPASNSAPMLMSMSAVKAIQTTETISVNSPKEIHVSASYTGGVGDITPEGYIIGENAFSNIDLATEAATSGDTILVHDNIENTFFNDKSLTFVIEDSNGDITANSSGSNSVNTNITLNGNFQGSIAIGYGEHTLNTSADFVYSPTAVLASGGSNNQGVLSFGNLNSTEIAGNILVEKESSTDNVNFLRSAITANINIDTFSAKADINGTVDTYGINSNNMITIGDFSGDMTLNGGYNLTAGLYATKGIQITDLNGSINSTGKIVNNTTVQGIVYAMRSDYGIKIDSFSGTISATGDLVGYGIRAEGNIEIGSLSGIISADGVNRSAGMRTTDNIKINNFTSDAKITVAGSDSATQSAALLTWNGNINIGNYEGTIIVDSDAGVTAGIYGEKVTIDKFNGRIISVYDTDNGITEIEDKLENYDNASSNSQKDYIFEDLYNNNVISVENGVAQVKTTAIQNAVISETNEDTLILGGVYFANDVTNFTANGGRIGGELVFGSNDNVVNINETNLLGHLDGGAGVDTLNINNTGDYTLNVTSINNFENINLSGNETITFDRYASQDVLLHDTAISISLANIDVNNLNLCYRFVNGRFVLGDDVTFYLDGREMVSGESLQIGDKSYLFSAEDGSIKLIAFDDINSILIGPDVDPLAAGETITVECIDRFDSLGYLEVDRTYRKGNDAFASYDDMSVAQKTSPTQIVFVEEEDIVVDASMVNINNVTIAANKASQQTEKAMSSLGADMTYQSEDMYLLINEDAEFVTNEYKFYANKDLEVFNVGHLNGNIEAEGKLNLSNRYFGSMKGNFTAKHLSVVNLVDAVDVNLYGDTIVVTNEGSWTGGSINMTDINCMDIRNGDMFNDVTINGYEYGSAVEFGCLSWGQEDFITRVTLNNIDQISVDWLKLTLKADSNLTQHACAELFDSTLILEGNLENLGTVFGCRDAYVELDFTKEEVVTTRMSELDGINILAGGAAFANDINSDYVNVEAGARLNWNINNSSNLIFSTKVCGERVNITGKGTLNFAMGGEYAMEHVIVNQFAGDVDIADGTIIKLSKDVEFFEATTIVNVDGVLTFDLARETVINLSGLGEVKLKENIDFSGDLSLYEGVFNTKEADDIGTMTNKINSTMNLHGPGSFDLVDAVADNNLTLNSDAADLTNVTIGAKNTTLATGKFGDIIFADNTTPIELTLTGATAANITGDINNGTVNLTQYSVAGTIFDTNVNDVVNIKFDSDTNVVTNTGTINSTNATFDLNENDKIADLTLGINGVTNFSNIIVNASDLYQMDETSFDGAGYLLISGEEDVLDYIDKISLSLDGTTYYDLTVGNDWGYIDGIGNASSRFFKAEYDNNQNLVIKTVETFSDIIYVNDELWLADPYTTYIDDYPYEGDERHIGINAAGSLDNAIKYIQANDEIANYDGIIEIRNRSPYYAVENAFMNNDNNLDNLQLRATNVGSGHSSTWVELIGEYFGRADDVAKDTTFTVSYVDAHGDLYGGAINGQDYDSSLILLNTTYQEYGGKIIGGDKITEDTSRTNTTYAKVDVGYYHGAYVIGGNVINGANVTGSASSTLEINSRDDCDIRMLNRVLGGSYVINGSEVRDNANVIIDFTNEQINLRNEELINLRSDIYAGGAALGNSTITVENTSVTFIGNAEHLVFTGKVSGGVLGNGTVNGTSELIFSDFTGDFYGKIREMNLITVKDSSNVDIQCLYDMAGANDQIDIEIGSVLSGKLTGAETLNVTDFDILAGTSGTQSLITNEIEVDSYEFDGVSAVLDTAQQVSGADTLNDLSDDVWAMLSKDDTGNLVVSWGNSSANATDALTAFNNFVDLEFESAILDSNLTGTYTELESTDLKDELSNSTLAG